MPERIIAISTKKKKFYFKAAPVAEEILDENGYPVHVNGAVPDGAVYEFASNLEIIKNYKNGLLHGRLQVVDLATGKTTLTEEYDAGELKSVVDTGTIAPLSPPSAQAAPPENYAAQKGLTFKREKDRLVFFKNGKEAARCSASDGALVSGKIPDGIIKEYYDGGAVRTEASYKNGALEGPFKVYDEGGRQTSAENYAGGLLNGGAAYYQYSGESRTKETLSYKNGKLEGRRTVFHANGREMLLENYEANRLEGRLEGFYETGILSIEENYKKGMLNGARVLYYPNGAVWYKEFYVNALLEGERTAFFPKGELYLKEKYEHGLLEDRRIIYDKTGTAVLEEEYNLGEKVKKRGRS